MSTRIIVTTEMTAYDENVANLNAGIELNDDLNVEEYLSVIFQVMVKFVGYQPESVFKALKDIVEFCDDPTRSEEENFKSFKAFYL